MIFLGKHKLNLEIDIDGKVESIPVHYAPSTKPETTKEKESYTSILKKTCKFDDNKDKKRFFELASVDSYLILLELNTLVQDARRGKHTEYWISYYTKKQEEKNLES